MNWAIGIITAPRETSYLARTLSSIADAGWCEFTIFAEPATVIPRNVEGSRVVWHPHRLGPHRNFRAAWQLWLTASLGQMLTRSSRMTLN